MENLVCRCKASSPCPRSVINTYIRIHAYICMLLHTYIYGYPTLSMFIHILTMGRSMHKPPTPISRSSNLEPYIRCNSKDMLSHQVHKKYYYYYFDYPIPSTNVGTSDMIADSWCDLARPPITRVDLEYLRNVLQSHYTYTTPPPPISPPPLPRPPPPPRVRAGCIRVLIYDKSWKRTWPRPGNEEKRLRIDAQTWISKKDNDPDWENALTALANRLWEFCFLSPGQPKKQIRSKLFIANPSSAVLLSLTNPYTTRLRKSLDSQHFLTRQLDSISEPRMFMTKQVSTGRVEKIVSFTHWSFAVLPFHVDDGACSD